MNLSLPSYAEEHVFPKHGGERVLLDTPSYIFILNWQEFASEFFKLWADPRRINRSMHAMLASSEGVKEEVGVNK